MAGLYREDLNALLQKGDYSDFSIVCKGTVFRVHKVILGVGSDFFKGLFRNEFKVIATSNILRSENHEH